MTRTQFAGLVVISALWGSSFLFMRVLSPVLGPIFTASFRLLFAALSLGIVFVIRGQRLDWKAHWKWFWLIGLINSAIPFVLYSFAALHLPASLSVILNSTAPMFGMIYGALLLNEMVTSRKLFGLLLGTIGVAIISTVRTVTSDGLLYVAIAACVLASSMYGLSGAVIKRHAAHIESSHLVLGSMLFGGISLLPFGLLAPIREPITASIVGLLAVFGALGTATAYMIYFRLIRDVGPVKALMTTYLMPVFGVVFGALILNETITWRMGLGLAVILGGIYLITSRRTRVIDEPLPPGV